MSRRLDALRALAERPGTTAEGKVARAMLAKEMLAHPPAPPPIDVDRMVRDIAASMRAAVEAEREKQAAELLARRLAVKRRQRTIMTWACVSVAMVLLGCMVFGEALIPATVMGLYVTLIIWLWRKS